MAQDALSSRSATAHLPASGVALLTTFRRNGAGVGTPVGITVLDGKVYFTTWSKTGKIKRLAGTPRVTLAPSTRAGTPTGPAIAGTARRLAADEVARIRPRLGGRFQHWIWLMIYRFVFRAKAVMYEVTPIED